MAQMWSTAAALKRQTARDVFVGKDPDALEAIHDLGVAAAIWQRRPEPGFQSWLDAVPAEQLPRLRVAAHVSRVEQVVIEACASVGLGPSKERKMLTGDIAAQAHIFSRIADTGTLALRLQVISTVSCPKFHIDHVPMRLLCTYRGTGTTYAAGEQIDTPSRHSTLPTGAVGLFRGELWPGEERCGLYHRSPEVGEADRARLLLVIDPAR